MKRALLAAAALALGITSSFAADIARAPVYKAAPMTPAYNWSGFYAGVMGGWATGEASSSTFGVSSDFDGGFIGGTLGANWQAPGSPWVWGVEVDAAWSDISDSASATVGGVTVTGSTDLDWFGTARLRAGYAWGTALAYLTGGVAWAHHEFAFTVAGPGIAAGLASDNTHTGWTIGGGLEWVVSGPWTAKVEYLFIDLGDETYFPTLAGGFALDGEAHTIKLGLNYRFGAY